MLEVFVLETEGDFGMPSEHAAFVMYLLSQPVLEPKKMDRKKKRITWESPKLTSWNTWKEEKRWKNDQPNLVRGTWDHDCTTPAVVGLFDGLDAFYF